MNLSDPNVIVEQEHQYLHDQENRWTAHANAEVARAKSIGQDVHVTHVCWGDGGCLYYSLCDHIQRLEIVEQNRNRFQMLEGRAEEIYNKNNDARRKLHGQVTYVSPIDQEMDKRQHSIYNPDFPHLTPWSLRQLVCDYVQDVWNGPNIPDEMRARRENFVIIVNENRRSQKTFDQIVNDQREPCEWSWDFFIQAASEVLRTTIWLMTESANMGTPYPMRKDNEMYGPTPMLIAFSNRHFQSLRPGKNPSARSLRTRQAPVSPQVGPQSSAMTTQPTSESKFWLFIFCCNF